MAQFVIKRDGSKEPFDPEKIKSAISSACRGANLAPEKVQDLISRVGGAAIALADSRQEIPTSELREKILADLDQVAPEVSQAWRDHDRAKGKV